MVSYQYKGIGSDGGRVEGTINAQSIEEAERKLAMQDVAVLSLYRSQSKAKQSSEKNGSLPAVTRKKVSAQDSATTLRNMAVMADAGVPFVEALDAVIASARTPVISDSLKLVKEAVVGGQGLAQSLRLAPNMFPAIIVDMIRVAEAGGRLDQALANGATYMERAAELRRKIINAMMYPMVMLGVSVATILILIIVVMPKFAQTFSQMKAQLPVTTKLMLDGGTFIRSQPLVALAVFAGLIFGTAFLLKLKFVQDLLEAIASRTPILGELIKRLAMTRSLQSIATLTASNVPLLVAIEQGARVASHRRISTALITARDEIERGKSMSEAMEETGAFPKQITQIIAVGERTGRLPQLLNAICGSMEEEVDGRLKALVSVIEPLMIVTMGVVVGSITMSIIGPIYSVVENIK
jgi:type II secretory pathway component PulF